MSAVVTGHRWSTWDDDLRPKYLRRKLNLAVVLMLVLLPLLFTGCGFKNRPLPPQQVVPKPITDLHYALSEKGVTLTWSYPTETVTGKDLQEVSEFVLYRAVVPVESFCKTCPIPFGNPVTLPGDALPRKGKKIGRYETMLLRPGNIYFFKIRAKNGWFAESDDSNVVSFLWDTPPAAPAGLTAKAGDGLAMLRWQPVRARIDGSPLRGTVRYRVLRSDNSRDFTALGKEHTETGYTDKGLRNGHKYFYKIQSVESGPHGQVAGGFSDIVSVIPVDQTPPPVPRGVRVIRSGSEIRVFWEPVPGRDLKGYRIYRRQGQSGKWVRIGEVNAPYVMYVDHTVMAAGGPLYYAVSSIDHREPANESDRSAAVQVR